MFSSQQFIQALALCVGAFLLLPLAAIAANDDPNNELPFDGSIEIEYSRYTDKPAPREAADHRVRGSIALTAERSVDLSAAGFIDIELFGRFDERDEERSHFDLRQALWTIPAGNFEIQFGVGRVFWGIAESRNIVDIINQSDFVEQSDGERKLGQALLKAAWYDELGNFEAYWLPHFRPMRLPGKHGRPATPFRYEKHDIQYEHPKRDRHQDFALRWAHLLGDVDIAVSYFKGTNREPRFEGCFERGSSPWLGTENGPQCDREAAIPQPEGTLEEIAIQLGFGPDEQALRAQALQDIVLVPHYDQIEQYGLELQWILGDMALKAEARQREQLGEKRIAAIGGWEYSFPSTFNLALDTRLIAEYHYEEEFTPAPNLFDNNYVVGLRVDGQDAAGSVLQLGISYNREDYVLIYSGEYSTRTSDNSRLEISAQVISHTDHLPEFDVANFIQTGEEPELNTVKFIEHEDIWRLRWFYYF